VRACGWLVLKAIVGRGNGGKERDTHLFMHHKAENAHHGGTSIVDLNGAFAGLGGRIKRIPAASALGDTVAEIACFS
jgi:hypothetical protein